VLNEKNKYKNLIVDIAYLVLIIAICYLCFNLFSWMIVNKNEMYKADIKAYINFALDGDNRKHRLPVLLFRLLYNINESYFFIALYLAAEIGFIFLANHLFIRSWTGCDLSDTKYRVLVHFLSIAAVFSGPIYVPRIHHWFYKNTFPIFAWHSPTQQMMTLFSVLALVFFYRMLADYEEGIRPLDWVLAAVCFFMSAYSKPSFILDLVPAIIVLFLIELFRRNSLSIGKKFARLVIMGMSAVPSGIYLIVLNYIIYTRSDRKGDSDIIVSAARFTGFLPLAIAICCSVSLPILVMIFNTKKLRDDRRYAMTALIALMGLLQWGLFSETGWRASHGNFTWGSTIGGFVFYVTSFAVLVDNLRDENFLADKKTLKGLYYVMAAGSLCLSLLSQGYYFITLYMGQGFWR